jgi:predicted transcriptional regulator
MTKRGVPEQEIVADRLTLLERAARIVREEIAGLTGEVVAERLGITRTTLTRKIQETPLATREEREKRPHLSAGEIAMLPLDRMLRVVSRLYLEPNGYAAVKLPDATKSGGNLELVTTMHRESSEATSAALAALSRGHMDRARALTLIKESRESIAVHLEAIAIAETALSEGVVAFNERGAA